MEKQTDIRLAEDKLFEQISSLIVEARERVKTTVNTAEVYTKYHIGAYIVEDEQQGEKRAAYGKTVLKNLSVRLTQRFGKGWSVDTLEQCLRLFLVYTKSVTASRNLPIKKSETPLRISETKLVHKGKTLSQISNAPQFSLSWSHYLILMRIENAQERSFYEIECREQNWSVRQLQRQYASSLYERLALSSRLAKQTHTKKASHSYSRKRSGM